MFNESNYNGCYLFYSKFMNAARQNCICAMEKAQHLVLLGSVKCKCSFRYGKTAVSAGYLFLSFCNAEPMPERAETVWQINGECIWSQSG